MMSDPKPGCYCGQWLVDESAPILDSFSPHNNEKLGSVRTATLKQYEDCVIQMQSAQAFWGKVPGPKRGEVVRQIGSFLRTQKEELGRLLTIEMGKIYSEGLGEIQEAIDICEYATGLSRKLNGTIFPSERRNTIMMEQYTPLGLVGCVTAFNFPVAVFFWNLALALVCGDCVMWKPSPLTPLISVAILEKLHEILVANELPPGIITLCCSGADVGQRIAADPRMKLVSFTGSSKVGNQVGMAVMSRFGRHILELGGNNAIVVMPDANQELALNSVLFASVGTCGQRCTTCRRLILHESLYDDFVPKLAKMYKCIPIGDPLDPKTLCGPLCSAASKESFLKGVEAITQKHGGKLLCGGDHPRPGHFVKPCLIEIDSKAPCVHEELFGPLLYVMKFSTFEEAVEINNSVPQGLSSSLFTRDPALIFRWTSEFGGADTGIVNVNMPTNGAEIGGAFGGEKATGGGRESGSDAWKKYMVQHTCSVNYSNELELAQGVEFDLNTEE